MYVSPHGKPEGLRKRLEYWAERMSTDPSLPWAGLGIIADIRAAIEFVPDTPQIKDFDL